MIGLRMGIDETSKQSAADTIAAHPQIAFSDVVVEFELARRDTLRALENVSFDVERDEFVSIIGPSGCGKSTLLKVASGLLAPTSGTAHVAGREVDAPQRDIGMVFQKASLLPWRSVVDNILLPIEILGRGRRQHVQRAHELLDLVGLSGFADTKVYELSGGMQQRVSICRALVHDPACLLMDEPFGALDAITREHMSHELLEIWENQRKTVLFVTHGISEALLLSDRIVVMTGRPGRVREIIDVDFPRPRSWDLEQTPEFIELASHLKGLLQT